MIAPCRDPRRDPRKDWHAGFLAMLPVIQRCAQVAFSGHPPEVREDLIEEVVANSVVVYARLAEQGRTDLAYPTVLAKFGIRQVRDGRRVGSRLPGVQQRRAIWRIYTERYGLDANQPRPVDADFSGAEIKACCRLAALLEVPLVEAAQNVVPVARTAHESIERLRTWASGRCLSADVPGVYTADAAGIAVKPGRKVRRDASNN